MRAVFLDRETLDRGDLDLAELEATVDELVSYQRTAREEILERLTGASVAVINKVPMDAETIRRLPDLKLICVAATGVDNVDVAACREAGIAVANCRGYGTDSVAQHTLALMLTLATRLPDYQQAVAAGEWERSPQFCLLDYPIVELAGRTLGIVGFGTLGGRVAALADALGMSVRVAARPGAAPTADRVPLDDLLPSVDVLSLHCPLTDATHGLIGARELALMQPHAFLINTARGGLVDEQALADALRAGRIGGAGFDVLTREPPREGNPLLAPDIPNLVMTPHSAWGSCEARARMVAQLAANIRGFTAGESVRRVV